MLHMHRTLLRLIDLGGGMSIYEKGPRHSWVLLVTKFKNCIPVKIEACQSPVEPIVSARVADREGSGAGRQRDNEERSRTMQWPNQWCLSRQDLVYLHLTARKHFPPSRRGARCNDESHLYLEQDHGCRKKLRTSSAQGLLSLIF